MPQRIIGAPDGVTPPPALLNDNQLAGYLLCSRRHVQRLVRAGRIPPPLKFGSLSRWSREEIERWIGAGCPPISVKSVSATSSEACHGA